MKRKLLLSLQVLILCLVSIFSSFTISRVSALELDSMPEHSNDAVHILGQAALSTMIPDYLRQIYAQNAWESVHPRQSSVVIALLDTGVDLSNPELKDSLIDGVNLLDPDSPPVDDNGHGTNVAGVIAAVANNHSRISGKIKIMPIKVIGSDGTGDVETFTKGIRYAVDHGANIIVCSLGLNYDSPNLHNAVQFAEQQGVLVAAATGNNGKAVKYPAAYPTVLAVGGETLDHAVHPMSNYGPEMDVIAPWSVSTTAIDGGNQNVMGTSMAAPQVAAAAALLLLNEPDLKPYQIRNLVCRTAEHLDPSGWNEHSGYGILRVDKLLAESDSELSEGDNNHTRKSAEPLSVEHMISAQLLDGNQEDWFYMDPPYVGTVHIQIVGTKDEAIPIQLTFYGTNDNQGKLYEATSAQAIELPVTKERSYIRIKETSPFPAKLTYKLTTSFQIYSDPFGDNHRMFKAFTLPLRSQEITGTFSLKDEKDWFELPVTNSGTLSIVVTTDTTRIDPALTFAKQGQKPMTIDLGGPGESEYLRKTSLSSGTYYFMVKNVISNHPLPVAGEYNIHLDFTPEEFKDIAHHWVEQAIVSLQKQDIVIGYGDTYGKSSQFSIQTVGINAPDTFISLQHHKLINGIIYMNFPLEFLPKRMKPTIHYRWRASFFLNNRVQTSSRSNNLILLYQTF